MRRIEQIRNDNTSACNLYDDGNDSPGSSNSISGTSAS